MAKTYGDLKSKVWALLGQKSTSTIFSPTTVGDALNSRILDFLRGKVTSLLDPNRIYSAGKLWIKEGTTYLRIAKDVTLTGDMTIGSVIISCDTTNFTTSGWVEVGGEQFSYTGKTSTTLTGVSTNTVLHSTGDNVRQLYTMPSNFEKPISVIEIDETAGFDIREIPLNSGSQFVYYEVVRKSSNLIRIIGVTSNSLISIKYSNVYTAMTSDSDICVIPDHYGISVIATIVAGELGAEKGLPNAQSLLIEGYAKLQNCYQYFDTDSDKIVRKIMPSSYKNNSIRVGKITQ